MVASGTADATNSGMELSHEFPTKATQKCCFGIPGVGKLCPLPQCNPGADLCHLHVVFLTRQFRQVGSRLDDVPAGWSRSSACCSLRGHLDTQGNEQQGWKLVFCCHSQWAGESWKTGLGPVLPWNPKEEPALSSGLASQTGKE